MGPEEGERGEGRGLACCLEPKEEAAPKLERRNLAHLELRPGRPAVHLDLLDGPGLVPDPDVGELLAVVDPLDLPSPRSLKRKPFRSTLLTSIFLDRGLRWYSTRCLSEPSVSPQRGHVILTPF